MSTVAARRDTKDAIMPIVSIASYILTLNQFVSHRANANAELGAAPLTHPPANALINFQTDRAALETALTNLHPSTTPSPSRSPTAT